MSAVPALLFEPGADWLRFFGRFHPLLVHLPIGGLFALLAAEALLGARPMGRPLVLRRALVLLFAASAGSAALAGWLLASEGGYDAALLDEHRRQGLIAAGLAAALALAELAAANPFGPLLRRALLLSAAVAVAVAGHHGGALTHGPTFLARYAPAGLRPWLLETPADPSEDPRSGAATAPGAEASAANPPGEPLGDPLEPAGGGLAARVRGLLAERCSECHGPDKQKGGLRLDTPGGLALAVVPGDAAQSELFLRVTLPDGDGDRMPPEGPALDGEQVGLLYAWIRAGAPWEDRAPASTDPGPRALGSAGAAAGRGGPGMDAAAADRALLTASGARFEALESAAPAPSAASQPELLWSVDLARSGAAPAESALDGGQLAGLAPLAERIVELDLSGRTGLGPALAQAPALPALRRFAARGSDLDDAALAALLARAPGLETLVLVGSPVGPASRAALSAAPALTTLYLAQTAFGEADLEALRAERPGRQIRGDPSLPADPFEREGPRQLLLADASVGRAALLREIALEHYENRFELPIEQLHDLQVLPDGALLLQTDWQTLVELDPRSGERRWSYDARGQNRPAGEADDAPLEVHSFERLPDGSTLIAESGRRRLIWVDRQGRLLHQVPLTVERPDAHHDTRLVRTTPAGTVLVAHEADGCVREYDREGRVVWSYAVPLFGRAPSPGSGPAGHGNQVFGAWRLADGRTRISTGNGKRVLEVDRDGQILWEFGPGDLPGVTLGWITCVQELPNRNLVITNCHAGPDQPQLIEIDRDKRLVWSFKDFERFGDGLSNAWIVPDPRRDGPLPPPDPR